MKDNDGKMGNEDEELENFVIAWLRKGIDSSLISLLAKDIDPLNILRLLIYSQFGQPQNTHL